MPVSADTLLGLAPTAPQVDAPARRVLGVDEWAWRKGHSYGTILVDLERRDMVDILPDRDASSFAAWLRAHPGVEVIVRDRAGAPNAVQVSDRRHLLRNLGDALAGVLDRHHHDLRVGSKAVAGATPEIGTAASPPLTTAPLPAPAAELPMTDRHGVR